MTREEWSRKLLLTGYIDEREAYTMSNIKAAPNGEYGLSLLCIKDDILSIYDTDFSGNAKQILYSIPLKEIRDVKLSTFVLHPTLKFTYDGFRFSFMAWQASQRRWRSLRLFLLSLRSCPPRQGLQGSAGPVLRQVKQAFFQREGRVPFPLSFCQKWILKARIDTGARKSRRKALISAHGFSIMISEGPWK